MAETRIQLCGPFVARIDGTRVEAAISGRQGRLLFAALVLERHHGMSRDDLADVLWGGERPASADSALSALLSKLRRVVPLEGRSDLRVALPADAWVDVDAASSALHRAEGAVARGDWGAAWAPARVTQHVYARPFLPGDASAWAADRRRTLDASLLRALELVGLAALQIGGGELGTAERAARQLVELAPLRESGTRLLMEVYERQGNRAEAFVAYEALRGRLREELGVAPAPETVDAHRRLLARSADL